MNPDTRDELIGSILLGIGGGLSGAAVSPITAFMIQLFIGMIVTAVSATVSFFVFRLWKKLFPEKLYDKEGNSK